MHNRLQTALIVQSSSESDSQCLHSASGFINLIKMEGSAYAEQFEAHENGVESLLAVPLTPRISSGTRYRITLIRVV